MGAARGESARGYTGRERERESPISPAGKGIYIRASFLLKNILPKEKETVSSSSSARGKQRRVEEEEKEEGMKKGCASLGVYPRVQLPYSGQPLAVRAEPTPEQRKAPSKPVSRVSQSRVKQLSAFAPSPERKGKWAPAR